jgi:DNA-binding beta-propeller fold protein YncE
MDKIQFQCSGCGKGLSAPADKVGRAAKCPSCGAALQVPQAPAHTPKPAPGPVVSTARSASTAPQFYYAQNGQRFGPIALNQMQERVASNQLHPEDLVWRDGMGQWVAAREVRDLFPRVIAAARQEEPSRTAMPSAVSASVESGERECFHCKHKLPRKICGQPASEYYQRQVDPRGVCSHVEVNPAVGSFVKGLARVIGNDCSEATIRLLKDALRMGLAEDDAVFARLKLVRAYFILGQERMPGSDRSERVHSPLFADALKQLEIAAKIDAERGYGFFRSDPDIGSLLLECDRCYSAVASSLRETKGVDAAIAYLTQKLSNYAFLPDDPMPLVVYTLGTYYEIANNRGGLRTCLERVLEAQPIAGSEEQREHLEQLKQMAREDMMGLGQGGLDPRFVQAAPPAPPLPSRNDTQSGRSIASARASVQAVKAKLFGSAAKQAWLQLYCPLRSKRETLSSETWFLLGILPPAAAFLLALVLIVVGGQFLTGAAIALIFAALVHLVSYLYISFLGPSGQDARQALAAISAQRETLRAELAAAQQKRDELYASALAQQANAVVQATALLPVAKAHAAGSALWRGAEQVLGLTDHVDWIESVAFSPDGQYLVSGSQDNSVRVWNARTGQGVSTFRGHAGKISSVAFSPDGRLLASGSDDTTLRIWNAGTGQRVHRLSHRRWCWTGHVGSLAFSPDGQRLVSGSSDWALRMWNVQTGVRMFVLKGHRHTVDSVAFSPNGQLLVSGGGDGTVRVWDSGTGQALLTLRANAQAVKGVAFSPDGQRIVSAGFDHTLKLWDVRTGQQILTLAGHTNWVYGVAFSPDGRLLVSGSRDETVKLWDVATGREILSLDADGWIFSVAFSPDGQRVASGGQGGIKVWEAR